MSTNSRENLQVTGNDLAEIKRSLNFQLQRVADRLDKLEGVRGTSTVLSNLDLSGNSLINAGNFDQNLGSADTPTFGGLTIAGSVDITTNLTVEAILDTDSLTVTDTNGTVIHEFS